MALLGGDGTCHPTVSVENCFLLFFFLFFFFYVGGGVFLSLFFFFFSFLISLHVPDW